MLAGAAAVLGIVGAACSGDDDDDDGASGTTSPAATCAAYDAALAAVNTAGDLDVAIAPPSEVKASMTALRAAVTEFSTVADYDAASLVEDVDAAVAGMPDADDVSAQQAMILLTDTKDTIIADTRSWLDDAPVDCD